MSSRSLPELLLIAFGALAEGIWCGAVAALLVGGSAAGLMVFAVATVFAGGALAHYGGLGRSPGLLARGLAVGLTLGAATVLVVAGRAWDSPSPLLLVVAAIIYSAVLVLLGAGLGRASLAPDVATRRGIRAFALLCLVLAAAATAGSLPWWAVYALAATLVASALLVATARYQTLTALAPSAEWAPAWAWLLAVLGVILLVVSAGALLGSVLRVDLLLWALAAVGDVLRFVLEMIGYAFAVVGAGLIRGVTWLLGLVHVHGLKAPKPPQNPHVPKQVLPPKPVRSLEWRLPHVLVTGFVAVVGVGIPLTLVALALRRFRRVRPREVVEEREAVLSLRSAAEAGMARLGRRLRRLASRPAPRTPAELVRRRYAELERRLARAGHTRSPATTVRAFLDDVCAGSDAPPDAAADLAGLYEVARYSDEAVDVTAARLFEAAALTFAAAAT